MTFDDITWIDRCSQRKATQSVTDLDIWTALERRHPGLLSDVHSMCGAGVHLYVPRGLETPRERAKRMDDGVMSAERLAELAGVCVRTAYRAKRESRGWGPRLKRF